MVKNWTYQEVLTRIWSDCNCHTLLVEWKMAYPFWKTVWQFLIKIYLHLSYNPAILSWVFNSKKNKTGMFTKILNMNVQISFVLSCPKLITTLKSFQLQMDMQALGTSIQWNTTQQYKSNELLTHTTRMNLNCIMPSEKARLKRLHTGWFHFIWHSRKGKLLGQKIEQVLPGASDEEEGMRDFGGMVMKMFYIWSYTLLHPSAPAERSHPWAVHLTYDLSKLIELFTKKGEICCMQIISQTWLRLQTTLWSRHYYPYSTV